MFANLLARRVDDVAGFFFEAFAKEFPHWNFSDETEPLAVFSFGIGQPRFSCDFPNFGFRDSPYGKIRFLQLSGKESRKKIGLVFRRIDSFQKPRNSFVAIDSGIMSGGNAVEAVRKGFFKKQVELDEIVAENVGIRG